MSDFRTQVALVTKGSRAEEVANAVRATGRHALLAQADITRLVRTSVLSVLISLRLIKVSTDLAAG